MLTRPSFETRLLRRIIFSRPTRLVWPPSWASHIPFAFWLVEALRPRTLVELGTQAGLSYSAFAQAVQTLGIDTACYAIDTWQGDEHAGFYDEKVFTEWSAFHSRHFGGFSRLIRSTFDEALTHFSDGSIDALHIDGLHTYEAVRHDFESWLPKLSDCSVVLFHDVNVREREFGVWQYWEEMRERYPSFTFTHGHGLGVLAVGRRRTADIDWLTSLPRSGEESADVQRVFSTIGDLWTQHLEVDQARAIPTELIASQNAVVLQMSDQLRRVHEAEAQLRAERDSENAQLRAERDAENHRAAQAANERDLASQRLAELTIEHHEMNARLEAMTNVHAAERAARVEAMTQASAAAAALQAEVEHAARLEATINASSAALETEVEHAARLEAMINASSAGLQAVVERAAGLEVEARTAADRVRELRRLQLHAGIESAELERRTFMLETARANQGRRRKLPARTSRGARVWVRQLIGGRLQSAGLSRAGFAEHPRHALWALLRPMSAQRALVEGSGLFDSAHYVAQCPDAVAAPLSHFLKTAGESFASPHPLFDTRFYLRQLPDLIGSAWNPLVHYLVNGAGGTADPHPLFSTRYYRERNPDVGSAPLAHFVQHGAAEGRSPHQLFDIQFYWHRRPDVRDQGSNALLHYLQRVFEEDLDPHPLFDTSFYFEQADGLREYGIHPLIHFLQNGNREDFRPIPWFDPQWYLSCYPDVATVGNPLVHYIEHGWREGRDPSPTFSNAAYLRLYPDVKNAGIDPLRHFVECGLAEGRVPTDLPASDVERPAPTILASGTSSAPPTVLCVSHVSPWPVRAGNEYRLARLLDHLQRRGHRIVLVLAPLPSEPMAPGAFERLAEMYGNVVRCDRDGKVTFILRDCPDVLSELGDRYNSHRTAEAGRASNFQQTDLEFCHDVVEATALALARALGRVAVVAEYIFMTRFFDKLGPNALRIVDTIDVFSQKGSNVVAYGVADGVMQAADEAKRLDRADVIIAIHHADAGTLKALAPNREVLVSGVDATVLEHAEWPDRPTAFLAGSANLLNVTGLRDFLRFCWPGVVEQVPDAELRIAGGVGRAAPPGEPGVTALGHVPDLSAEYRAARVVINPAVAGTGLKIKTVEALAHLRPVVGWPHNRDGLPDAFTDFVYEAANWDDFAQELVRRLRQTMPPFDPPAIAMITRQLSADVVYRDLDDRLARFFVHRDHAPAKQGS